MQAYRRTPALTTLPGFHGCHVAIVRGVHWPETKAFEVRRRLPGHLRFDRVGVELAGVLDCATAVHDIVSQVESQKIRSLLVAACRHLALRAVNHDTAVVRGELVELIRRHPVS